MLRKTGFSIIPVLFAMTLLSSERAAAQEDSLFFSIDSSAVVSYRSTAPIRGDLGHVMTFSPSTIKAMPKFMGDVDPMVVIQSMPGVHTNSVMDAGLFIHGFEDSHNCYTIAGAPAYLTPRMFGFFPILNQSHFAQFRFKTDAEGCHLGGTLESEISDTTATGFHGDASLGMMSARATFSVPLHEKLSLTASFRQSFINQVYKGMLKYNSSQVKYGFTDINASLLWNHDDNNSFDADFYYSRDDAGSDATRIAVLMGGTWRQGTASARWRHKGEIGAEAVVYSTWNLKDFYLNISETKATTPSDLAENGLRLSLTFPLDFRADVNVIYREITPLSIFLEGGVETSTHINQKGMQSELGISKKFSTGLLTFIPALHVSGYDELTSSKTYFHVDPELRFEINMLNAGILTISGSRKHQYFSQMGITTSGVPFRFWVGSGEYTDPQESHKISVSHTIDLDGGAWTASTQAYWARLYNQLEFRGFVMDFLSPEYKLEDSMVKTDGNNYGANIMLSKNTGALTGWISYSYSRAMRHSCEEGMPALFPSTHDRPHELNAMLTWHIWKLDIGAMVSLASGDPYTRVKDYYFVGNKVVAEYEDFNSSRLKNYFKADISIDYALKSFGRYTHGLNLSVFNVTGHTNESIYFLCYKDLKYRYQAGSFIIPVMPSISYYCKF